MKTWKNYTALKGVKLEIEALSTAMGSALEAVIATPADENKDIKPLLDTVREFSRIPGILDLLEFRNLSLLGNEILQLLNDTLESEATLDPKELDLRLESAFVAVTDLPALLEYSLNQSKDKFIYVCQHANRLRKARACAIVFSSVPLLEKPDVDFRSRFTQHPEKMQEILAKQAEAYVRFSTALRKNPDDRRALQLLSAVLNNLELMLRDHKIGVLWGLGRALAEILESANSDKEDLASCLLSLVPYARKLIEGNSESMQDTIDEALLERIVQLIAGNDTTSGRPGIVKLWYSLDMASSKEFRAEYRRLQVRYYNKGALSKCLNIIKDDINQLIDSINNQAEAADLHRQGVNEVYAGISNLNKVVAVLRMHYLADMVDASLPAEPVANLEEALSQAASVLFKMNKEVCNKLDSMEREVFSTDKGITAAESMNSGRLQILKTAISSLESVIVALDNHVDLVRKQGEANDQTQTEPEHLQEAHRTLDQLASVLNTLPLSTQAQSLAIARDYIAWLLNQSTTQDIDTTFQALSYLLINSSWYLEQLAMGRDEDSSSSLDLAVSNAAALQQFLASAPPETHEKVQKEAPQPEVQSPGSNRLFVISTESDRKIEPPVLTDEWSGAEAPEMPKPDVTAEESTDESAGESTENSTESSAELAVSADSIETAEAEEAAVAGVEAVAEARVEAVAGVAAESESGVESEADDDIREIFAEEFDEVLEALQTDHESLIKDPTKAECIKDCRRHFHTLKGSGRMVGANVISRLAELMEKVYDQAGNKGGALSAGTLNLTARCIELLPGLKTDFCEGAEAARGDAIIDPLCREAQALLAGEAISPDMARVAPEPIRTEKAEEASSKPEDPLSGDATSEVQVTLQPEESSQRPIDVAVASPEESPEEVQEEVQKPVQETTQVETSPGSAHEVEPETAEATPIDVPSVAAAVANQDGQDEEVDQTLLAIFLEEADDLLQGLDATFLKWQQDPVDKGCVAEYLRLLHTMKGSSALVCEHELSKAAHDHETYILDVQRSKRALDSDFFVECDRRLQVMHNIRSLYARDDDGHFTRSSAFNQEELVPATQAPASQPSLPAADQEPVVQAAFLQETLTATKQPELPAAPVFTQPISETVDKPPQRRKSDPQQDISAPAPDEQVRVSSKLLRSLLNDADEINFSRSRIENTFQDIGILLSDMDETLNRFLAYVKNFEQKAGARQKLSDAIVESSSSHSADFDTLEMDRYTELQQLSLSMTEDYNDLQDIRINLAHKVKDVDNILTGQQRSTNSLQDGLISSQMVPFDSVVPRLERLVRQISGKLGKQVRFEVQNQQGSLDKNILQAILTPLEHIIRNAIDHGIETTEARNNSGKKDVATLKIAASRQGASFVIRISDDGQGIDVEKVMQHARNKGLLEEGAVLRNEDAYRLLFQSGFSTSAAVSNISGRGVGLDVVKSEIEHVGGSVEIESTRGEGTTFIITLPLTSSLNRALLFEIQETRYVVLMNTLDGVLVEKLANIHQKQQQQINPDFQYGGKTYEYLYLGKLINESFKPKLDSIDNSIPLLLVSSHDRNFALHIDSIIESRDLVVKSIGQQFASIPGIAGGVIMPDGNVAIVLELKALVSLYGKEPAIPAEVPVSLSVSESTGKPHKLVMVVDDSITVRKVTSTILKRNGMDVLTAKNGLEAVDLLEHTVPDVILLDIEMPKMDGFEFATHVRAQPKPICDIPIIMITSRIGDKHRTRAESIGVNQYLCKPFEEANLLEYIRSY